MTFYRNLFAGKQSDLEDTTRIPAPEQRLRYRSIWISDLHLGVRDAKAEFVYEFLRHTESDVLYLVGDIVDIWKLKHGWYWPTLNNNIIRLILRKARQGTKVIYIPGNHDEMVRDFVGNNFGDVEIHERYVHTMGDGRRLLVLHGDEFDGVVKHNKWLALVGSEAYDLSLKLNRWLNHARRKLGLRYWSLSAYLKHRVKNAVNFISNFNQAVVHEARRHQVDGAVCGHIHTAAMTYFEDVLYCNTGDWVESCTALVETEDSDLELLFWTDKRQDFIAYEPVAHEDRHRHGRLATSG